MVNFSNSNQNVKLLVQSNWNKYLIEIEWVSNQNESLLLKTELQTPIHHRAIVIDFFQILTFYIYIPFDSKFNAEKKNIIQKWTARKLFLKNCHVYRQILEAPLLSFSKEVNASPGASPGTSLMEVQNDEVAIFKNEFLVKCSLIH